MSSNRIEEIHRRLIDAYGEQRLRSRKPPLDELIFTVLSQNTSDVNRDRAWDRLREGNPSWEEVSSLPVRRLERRIRVGGLARQKSKRIHSILQAIKRERGTLDLEFLREMSDEEIRRYLLAFPGVGPKTVACLLLFSLGRPAFPVDTHIHRLSARLGLIPRETSAAAAHDILRKQVPEKMDLTLHLNLIAHGRTVCRARKPLCDRCVLNDLCPKLI